MSYDMQDGPQAREESSPDIRQNTEKGCQSEFTLGDIVCGHQGDAVGEGGGGSGPRAERPIHT